MKALDFIVIIIAIRFGFFFVRTICDRIVVLLLLDQDCPKNYSLNELSILLLLFIVLTNYNTRFFLNRRFFEIGLERSTEMTIIIDLYS